ncbi:MAG: PAS domain-containing protein [Desulfovermiculus sp.]|nr:PAS domain-containing protein [Desulfovermiculus sp.]
MDINLSPYHQSDLFDTVTDLMAVLDLEFRIQWANRAAGESVGEDPENLLGRYCYQVWHGRDTPCEQCPVQSTIRTGMHHKGEVESPDGKVFLIKSYPLRTPEGELKGVTEVALDITEYRRAEKTLRRRSEEQALLLESVPTQIWYLTDVETYGVVNQAHADFCGLSLEEMEYRKLGDFLPEEEARVCREGNVKVFCEGRPIRTEEWLHDANGEKRLIEIVKTPKLDGNGNVEYAVCAGSDITERKRADEALQHRLEFEERISTISHRFINLHPGEFNSGIRDALALIGQFVEAGRAYVFQFHDEQQFMSNTHEWCAQGVSPARENLQNVPAESIPWWTKKLKNFETIHLRHLDDLPPEAENTRKVLEPQNIQSLIALPMRVENSLVGFIGFDAVYEPTEWSTDTVSLLQTTGEIIASALQRHRFGQELEKTRRRYQGLLVSQTELVVSGRRSAQVYLCE